MRGWKDGSFIDHDLADAIAGQGRPDPVFASEFQDKAAGFIAAVQLNLGWAGVNAQAHGIAFLFKAQAQVIGPSVDG
jgi:hypothetical protein